MRSILGPDLQKECGNAGLEVSFQARRRSSRPDARVNLGQRGYVLVMMSLGVVFLLGIGGLAVDVGRMYITKSEAQSFCRYSGARSGVRVRQYRNRGYAGSNCRYQRPQEMAVSVQLLHECNHDVCDGLIRSVDRHATESAD